MDSFYRNHKETSQNLTWYFWYFVFLGRVSLAGENAQEKAWCVYPWQKRFAIKLLITPSHHKTEGHNIFGITMTLTRGTPHMSLAKRLIEHQKKKGKTVPSRSCTRLPPLKSGLHHPLLLDLLNGWIGGNTLFSFLNYSIYAVKEVEFPWSWCLTVLLGDWLPWTIFLTVLVLLFMISEASLNGECHRTVTKTMN